jgi:hypothetical protein
MPQQTNHSATAADLVAQHVIATLPESIVYRKRMLGALIELLPQYEDLGTIKEMLSHLQHHEGLQQEFPSIVQGRIGGTKQ